MSDDPSQLDDGGVACHPGGGPVGVVNATPLQCGGEGGAEGVLRQDVVVVVVSYQFDGVLPRELLQVLNKPKKIFFLRSRI